MKFSSILGLLVLALAGCASTTERQQLMEAEVATPPNLLQSAPNKLPAASGNSATHSGNQSGTLGGTSGGTSGGALQPITASQAANQAIAQLTPPADLWERIRRGYAMPNLESDLVRDREQWYSTRPDYIERMTERSRKYLFHIVEELEMRNMPTELALLPFIESAFNPQAVSSAKAAGMWQFMPATGRHFELKQNVFRDDRRDVLASTRAALDYLQKLHKMFGDWHLALAAYNWGEGSVGRAIAKNKKAGLGVQYLDLSMPAETRQYVPKLQAVKNIVTAPQTYNAKLPLIENHPFFQTATLTKDIDVALAAKLAEVSLEDFKALNPSAHQPVLLAAGNPQILLPWDNAAVFEKNLSGYNGARLATWTVWIAPTTMSASKAAQQAGMNETEFRNINRIPPKMLIKAGSSLVVPRSTRVENDVAVHVADNGQLGLSPEVTLRQTTVKLKKAESLASLAKRYKISPASVAQANNVNLSAHFVKGQQVLLMLPSRAKASAKGKPAKGVKIAKKGVKPR